MQTYTFFHVDSDNAVPSFEVAYCANLDEARARAPAIFRERRDCAVVEIWTEAGEVFTVERADALPTRMADVLYAGRFMHQAGGQRGAQSS